MNKPGILIVEDEAVVAEDLRMQLLNHGYEVCGIAKSGLEAIQKAQCGCNIVLMDILLRGEMNGIQTAKIIQDKIGIPVIFLTALRKPAEIPDLKPFDPCGYLPKPFTEEELRDCIDNALKFA